MVKAFNNDRVNVDPYKLRVFVDLDGVLVDFLGAVHKFYGLPFSHSREDFPYPVGEYVKFPPPELKMSGNKFWSLPIEFWRDAPWTDDGKEILATIESYVPKKQICILTATTIEPLSAAGKVEWIKKNIGSYRRRYLLGPVKAFCAGPNSVLIDDADYNYHAFNKAGGNSILIPRLWNEGHPSVDRVIESLKVGMERMMNIKGGPYA
jgi:hypothetical protein